MCTAVRGTNWGPLICYKRAPEVFGSFDVSKQGWDSRGFAPGANGWQTQNFPTPEEESTLLGEGQGCQKLQKLLHPSRNIWKLLNPRNLAGRLMLWVPLSLQNPTVNSSRKQKDPNEGLSPKAQQPPTQISPATGSRPTSKRVGRYQTGGRNSGLFAARVWAPQWHSSPSPG